MRALFAANPRCSHLVATTHPHPHPLPHTLFLNPHTPLISAANCKPIGMQLVLVAGVMGRARSREAGVAGPVNAQKLVRKCFLTK